MSKPVRPRPLAERVRIRIDGGNFNPFNVTAPDADDLDEIERLVLAGVATVRRLPGDVYRVTLVRKGPVA